MSSKKLVATLAVLAATALTPAAVAQAAEQQAPKRPAPVLTPGTQVGSEGIIAILIGLAVSPQPAGIASDGIGASYARERQIEPTSLEVPNLT